ncbi:MAG: hypothetical protein ACLTER_22505 [Ruminococcus sp.]
MKKKYKAVFFDWDGTWLILSRKAPVEEIVGAMRPLLDQKVNLVIGKRNYNRKYCRGKLETYFTKRTAGAIVSGTWTRCL